MLVKMYSVLFAFLTGMGVVTVCATAAQASQPEGAVPTGVYKLIARHSGKCVTVHGNTTASGAAIDQYTCVGRSNQRWRVINDPTVAVSIIVAENSGKCMDVQGGSKNNGANVIQWPCSGASNQNFFIMAPAGGYSTLRPAHAGGTKCLDVSGKSTANNARLILWGCNGGNNQSFQLVRA